MRITKRQLRQIIKEESQKLTRRGGRRVLRENAQVPGEIEEHWNMIIGVFADAFPSIDSSYMGNQIWSAIEAEWNKYSGEESSNMSREQDRADEWSR